MPIVENKTNHRMTVTASGIDEPPTVIRPGHAAKIEGAPTTFDLEISLRDVPNHETVTVETVIRANS